jgi:hypothetical protein
MSANDKKDDEEAEEDDCATQVHVDTPSEKRIVDPARAISLEISCLSWEELGMDEKKESVYGLKTGCASTLNSFCWAVSRFLGFLKHIKDEKDTVFSEGLLCDFVDFLWNLTCPKTKKCVISSLGSFFPTLSHVKRYLLLKHSCIFSTKLLSQKLKIKFFFHTLLLLSCFVNISAPHCLIGTNRKRKMNKKIFSLFFRLKLYQSDIALLRNE